MKRNQKIVIAASLLFIALNVFAILYSGSPVKRTSFVTAWMEPPVETLVKTYTAKGVAVPAEEHHVYYHAEEGEFKEFLVKEGDEVSEGTPLFSYTSERADADRERLLGEQSKAEHELRLIEEQIAQLEYLQTIAVTMESPGQSVMVGGEELYIEPGVDSGEMLSAAIEREIFDKERELSLAEEALAEYDERIAQLEENSELEKLSEVAGTVKKIDHKLGHPAITIVSDTPKITGRIPEIDLPLLSSGMRAHITSSLLPDKLDGTLTTIAQMPEAEPDVETESFYTFEIELVEGAELDFESDQEDWELDEFGEDAANGEEEASEADAETDESADGAESVETPEADLESSRDEEGSLDAFGLMDEMEGDDLTPEEVEKLFDQLLKEAEGDGGVEDRLGDEEGIGERNPLDPGLSDPVDESDTPVDDGPADGEDPAGEEEEETPADGSDAVEEDAGETAGEGSGMGLTDLVMGSHVNVSIVTDEVKNALTVSHDQIKAGSYVYVITPGGRIERRSIQLGLETDSRIQVSEGLKSGETILTDPKQAAGSKTRFVTPADPGQMKLKTFRDMPLKEVFLRVGVGFSKQ